MFSLQKIVSKYIIGSLLFGICFTFPLPVSANDYLDFSCNIPLKNILEDDDEKNIVNVGEELSCAVIGTNIGRVSIDWGEFGNITSGGSGYELYASYIYKTSGEYRIRLIDEYDNLIGTHMYEIHIKDQNPSTGTENSGINTLNEFDKIKILAGFAESGYITNSSRPNLIPKNFYRDENFNNGEMVFDKKTGLRFHVYKNVYSNEVVVVFTGSEFTLLESSLQDILTDLLGGNPQSFPLKLYLDPYIEALNHNQNPPKIYFTGHSLGGGLTQHAAYYYGKKYNNMHIEYAHFNAPGWAQYVDNDLKMKIDWNNQVDMVNPKELLFYNLPISNEQYNNMVDEAMFCAAYSPVKFAFRKFIKKFQVKKYLSVLKVFNSNEQKDDFFADFLECEKFENLWYKDLKINNISIVDTGNVTNRDNFSGIRVVHKNDPVSKFGWTLPNEKTYVIEENTTGFDAHGMQLLLNSWGVSPHSEVQATGGYDQSLGMNLLCTDNSLDRLWGCKMITTILNSLFVYSHEVGNDLGVFLKKITYKFASMPAVKNEEDNINAEIKFLNEGEIFDISIRLVNLGWGTWTNLENVTNPGNVELWSVDKNGKEVNSFLFPGRKKNKDDKDGWISGIRVTGANEARVPLMGEATFSFKGRFPFDKEFGKEYVVHFAPYYSEIQTVDATNIIKLKVARGENAILDNSFLYKENIEVKGETFTILMSSYATESSENNDEEITEYIHDELSISQGPQVLPLPDYTIYTDIELKDLKITGNITPHQELKVEHSIKNIGPENSAGSQIRYFISQNPNEKGVELGKFEGGNTYNHSLKQVSGIEVGEEQKVEHALKLSSIFPGENFITAELQNGETQQDIFPDNNTTQTSFFYNDINAPQGELIELQYGIGKERNTYVRGESYNIVSRVKDDSGIDNIDIFYSLNNGETWEILEENFRDEERLYDNGTTFDIFYNWNIPAVIEETQSAKIRIVGRDLQGNVSQFESEKFAIIDGTPVTITFDEISNNREWGIQTSQTVKFSFNKEILGGSLSLQSPSGHLTKVVDITPEMTEATYMVPGKTSLIGSNYKLVLEVIDRANNTVQKESQDIAIIRGTVEIDEQAPTVTVNLPDNDENVFVNEIQNFEWSIEDESMLEEVVIHVRAVGAAMDEVYRGTENNGTFAYDFQNFEPYTDAKVFVMAKDSVGNVTNYEYSFITQYSEQELQMQLENYNVEQQARGNRISNAGFEVIQGKNAYGWNGSEVSSLREHSGIYGLKILEPTSHEEFIPVEGDAMYMFEGRVYSNGSNVFHGKIIRYNENKEQIGEIFLPDSSRDARWELYQERNIYIDNQTHFVKVVLEGTYNTSWTLYVDDVFFGIDEFFNENYKSLVQQKQDYEREQNIFLLSKALNDVNENMVKNGSFENEFDFWNIFKIYGNISGNSRVYNPIVQNTNDSGNVFTYEKGVNGVNQYMNRLVSDRFELEGNKKYVFSVDVKWPTVYDSAGVRLKLFDNSGKYIGDEDISTKTKIISPLAGSQATRYFASTKWKSFGNVFVLPEDTAFGEIEMSLENGSNITRVMFDNVTLHEVTTNPTEDQIQNVSESLEAIALEKINNDNIKPFVVSTTPNTSETNITNNNTNISLHVSDTLSGVNKESLQWFIDHADGNGYLPVVQNGNEIPGFQANIQPQEKGFVLTYDPKYDLPPGSTVQSKIVFSDNNENSQEVISFFTVQPLDVEMFSEGVNAGLDMYSFDPSFGDINNDGLDDMIFFNTNKNQLNIHMQTNEGWQSGRSESARCSGCSSRYQPINFTLIDINGDGYKDVFYTRNSDAYVKYNRKNGTFDSYRKIGTFGNVMFQEEKVFPINIDGDAYMDILVVSSRRGSYILKNNRGSFTEMRTGISGSGLLDAHIFDYNNDGYDDVIVANSQSSYGYVSLYKGLGTGNFQYKNKLKLGGRYVYPTGVDSYNNTIIAYGDDSSQRNGDVYFYTVENDKLKYTKKDSLRNSTLRSAIVEDVNNDGNADIAVVSARYGTSNYELQVLLFNNGSFRETLRKSLAGYGDLFKDNNNFHVMVSGENRIYKYVNEFKKYINDFSQ